MLFTAILAGALAQPGPAILLQGTEAAPPNALVQALAARVAELDADPAGPHFQLHALCEGRAVVAAPRGHDLAFWVPNPGGASTERIPLEPALARVLDWIESEPMRPLQVELPPAASRGQPLVLLVLERLHHRELFNLRYSEGTILEEVVYWPLLPFGHEDCVGVPCALPGSCGDSSGCAWEVHVPLCELVDRSAAHLLERRFGPLPPGLTGLAEIVEVGVAGGHYSYRYFGTEARLVPVEDRDGYADEFAQLLKKEYRREKERDGLLAEALGWSGRRHDPRRAVASWGLAQTLLLHSPVVGKGDDRRNLGDLLLEVGRMQDQDWTRVAAVLQDYDPQLLRNLGRKPSAKERKAGPAGWIGA
jgi:hypothetical protein